MHNCVVLIFNDMPVFLLSFIFQFIKLYMRFFQFYALLLLFCFTATTATLAQGCLPDGLLISTQSEIDQFQTNYPGCTRIIGDLTIFGADILNLHGLSTVQTIGGNLSVDGTSCTSLQGLQNLVQVDGQVYFPSNENITDLTGLTKLKIIGGDFDVSYSSNFVNLNGLNAIEQIGGSLRLYKNSLMTDVSNLSAVDSLGGVNMFMNPKMTSMSGLVNLRVITGGFNCSECNTLTNFNQLSHLEKIGGSFILYANPLLSSLTGFVGMTSITTDNSPEINDNPSLIQCSFPAFCTYLSQGGNSTLSGNGSGCNSAPEVIASCQPTNYSPKEIPSVVVLIIGHKLLVKSEKPVQYLILRDVSGVELLRSNQDEEILDLKNISPGVYFADVFVENQSVVKKIIVEK